MSIRAAAVALALIALVAACGDSSPSGGTTTPASGSPSPAVTVTAAPGEAPLPQRLTFAPGETIAADGKAGIFFLDPYTGAAEAWVAPADEQFDDGGYYLPFAFTVGGFATDGSRVVYSCRESGTSGLHPCSGGTREMWYLLDTRTGSRSRLDTFTGSFLSISPDGKNLLGETADGLALANAEEPGDVRPVVLPSGVDLTYMRADWGPRSRRAVLSSKFLINVEDARALSLPGYVGVARWSPDGSRFTLGRAIDKERSDLVVLDRDGEEIWSKPIAASGVDGVWSGDGRYLYAEEQELPGTPDGYGPLDRVIVLDADTGATAYRIRGGFCPIGWAGTSHTLLTSSYGLGEVVADLDAGALRLIDEYVMPTPFDDDLAIMFDGSDFRSYSLSTGAIALIAHTTVFPAWDSVHEPLFAGKRLAFTSLHGGHGGCGEGAGPKEPPRPELLAGPFADDAPVTRGGVH